MEVEEIQQLFEAAALVGKYVRFAHLPEEIKPTPIRVTGAKSGMIQLEGWAGEFAPHLFVEVEQEVEQAVRCSLLALSEKRKASSQKLACQLPGACRNMLCMPRQPGKPFRNICVRPTAEDLKLLNALRARLGLEMAPIVRLALRALAKKEGVKA